MELNKHIKKYSKRVNPARRIVLSFSIIILVGSILLMLPVSSRTGEWTPFITTLFTATSATCVTGLVMVDTGAYFSLFGQMVILLMIQFGGLGFMTVLTTIFIAANKNIGIRDRMLIAQSFGLNNMSGGIKVILSVIKFTAIFEGVGAVLLMMKFIPEYGIKGIWYGIFHSISAFCNAGFDVLGTGDSVMKYANDPYVLLVLASLIVAGGLGFVVWNDIFFKKSFRKLEVYSKLVLIITAVLLIGGTVMFMITERNNAGFGSGFFERLLSATFQSVTTRTAGFDSVGQTQLSESGKLTSILLMMVGGASGSTAGGLKVVTVGILFITAFKVLMGRREMTIVGKSIGMDLIMNALALIMLWIMLVFGGALFVSIWDNVPIIDSVYELTSAYGTVGLTNGLTDKVSIVPRILYIMYMFFGRVGVMTISMIFMSKKTGGGKLTYPPIELFIG